MTGSIFICKADMEAEVRQILEGDVYTQGGIWDLEKVQITPVS